MSTFEKRFIVAGLSVVLMASPLLSAVQVAYAAPAPTAVSNAVSENGSNQIPVTIYDGENPTSSRLVSVESGTISDRVPKWDGYTFVRAWLRSPENPSEQVEISQINYVTGQENNGLPNNEPYVEIKPVDSDNDPIGLCVPISQASRFLYYEYIKVGQVINLNYSTAQGADIKISGPNKIFRQSNGLASGYFSVSVPRNCEPRVESHGGNNVTLNKVEDLSTIDRTVFRYEVTADKNFQGNLLSINVVSQKKTNLSITFEKPDLSKSNYASWDLGTRRKNTPMYGNPSKKNYNFGDTITFNVYHDRAQLSPTPFQILLASLLLNGIPFGAPQPFARYGPNAYDMETYKYERTIDPIKTLWLNGKTYEFLKPPGYSVPDGNWGKETSQDLRPAPYYVQSFSFSQGWLNNGTGEASLGDSSWIGYLTWWKSQICNKVIGSYTDKLVDSGPLAGAIINIEVLDAVPYYWTRNLGDYPANQPDKNSGMTSYIARGNVLNGFCNSMCMAYKVTIKNAPVSLEVASDWINTGKVKVGIYENEGVNNVQVYAGPLSTNLEDKSPTYSWKDLPEKKINAWVDVNSLPGTIKNSNVNITENAEPSIRLRGNVENGYHNPVAISTTYNLDGLKPLPRLSPGSDGYGYEVEIPVVAKGGDVISGGTAPGRVLYGGMSTVGVKASPMKIPVYFDLDGGSFASGKKLPSESEGKPEYFDVDSSPIAHISDELPSKQDEDGSQSFALSWRLYYRDARNPNKSSNLVDTGKTFLPGSSFDIGDVDQVGTRLSNAAGNDLVSSFVLKAVYEDSPENSPNVYKTSYQFNNVAAGQIFTKPGPRFHAVRGVYAFVKDQGGFPDQLQEGGITYHINGNYKESMRNVKVLLGSNTKPVFQVPYSSMTEAQRWQQQYGTAGRTATYEWGSTINRDSYKRLIRGGEKLPDSVKIQPYPAIDTYSPTEEGQPQYIGMVLTFSDGSQLQIVGFANVTEPHFLGVSLGGKWPQLMLGLSSLLAGGFAAHYFYRRRKTS